MTEATADATLDISRPDQVGERQLLTETSLRKYFETAVKFEASDLLMRGGQRVKLRFRGTLRSLDTPPIDSDEFEKAIEHSLTPGQWQQYARAGSIDVGVDLNIGDAQHRFRINIFRTRGRSALAARLVSNKILNFEQLLLPTVLEKLCHIHQGLILIAGVTGSGKSTTIASMLQHINETRACHILTIEDPIEYLFSDNKAMISQREVGIDVPDFPTGLKALVRENPDVVLIGEMRDKETFEAALQASETGHLVFGTIHASSAAQAFGRIYDLFPQNERDAIRTLLAYQMVGFVYQKLLPCLKEEIQRVPAVEILLQSPPTRRYILDGREHELDEVIKEQKEAGMQRFTDSLVKLVNGGLVDPKIAKANASNPDEFSRELRGITT